MIWLERSMSKAYFLNNVFFHNNSLLGLALSTPIHWKGNIINTSHVFLPRILVTKPANQRTTKTPGFFAHPQKKTGRKKNILTWNIESWPNQPTHPRWWFQFFLLFTRTWGNDPIWRAYFSNGLKPPTSQLYTVYHYFGGIFYGHLVYTFLSGRFALPGSHEDYYEPEAMHE